MNPQCHFFHRIALCLLLAAATLATGPAWAQLTARAAPSPDTSAFRLAGNEQVAYIVLPGRANKLIVFDVLRRNTGEGWKRVTTEPITGVPILTAAVGRDLHLFFPPLQAGVRHGILKSDGSGVSMQMDPSGPGAREGGAVAGGAAGVTWPVGARPRAACEAVGFAGVSAPTLLAVVPLPTGRDAGGTPALTVPQQDSLPEDGDAGRDDRAMTRPRAAVREELALFQLVESRWVYRGSVTTTVAVRDTRVHLAVADGTAYVLIDQPAGTSWRSRQLWACHPDMPAREITLPVGISHGTAQSLALLGMEKTLMLLMTTEPPCQPSSSGPEDAASTTAPSAEAQTEPSPPAGEPVRTTAGDFNKRTQWNVTGGGDEFVMIYLYDGQSFHANAVHTSEDTMMSWRNDELPQAVRWGDYIQLVWGREKRHSARLDPGGRMTAPDEINVVSQSDPRAAMKAYHWYMMGAMVVVVLLTLLSKPSGPPRPFSLPPHMQPGKLGRRLVATMLDVFPCLAVGMAIAGWDESAEGIQALSQMQPPAAGNSAAFIAMMIAMSLLLVYSTLAEWKTGATIGKRMMGLCVVGDEGKPLTARAVALRNVMKLLELFSMMLPLMLIFPVITRYRQRLGDIFARTAVIDRDTAAAPPTLPGTGNDDAETRGRGDAEK